MGRHSWAVAESARLPQALRRQAAIQAPAAKLACIPVAPAHCSRWQQQLHMHPPRPAPARPPAHPLPSLRTRTIGTSRFSVTNTSTIGSAPSESCSTHMQMLPRLQVGGREGRRGRGAVGAGCKFGGGWRKAAAARQQWPSTASQLCSDNPTVPSPARLPGLQDAAEVLLRLAVVAGDAILLQAGHAAAGGGAAHGVAAGAHVAAVLVGLLVVGGVALHQHLQQVRWGGGQR